MTEDERKDWETIKRHALGMFRTACRRLNLSTDVNDPVEDDFHEPIISISGKLSSSNEQSDNE